MRLQKFLILALAIAFPMAARAQNTISTVAGGGSSCPTGTPCNLSISIGGDSGVAKDSAGNTYILDYYYSRLFKVDTAGNVTIVVGNSTAGYTGNGVAANTAVLNASRGLFVDTHDNIFIADADNGIIREIPAATGTQYGIAMTAGNIYTVAGVAGQLNYGGDGFLATNANLFFPDGVWVDAAGDIFIADKGNSLVREVPNSTGTFYGIAMTANNIYTVAGKPDNFGYSGDTGLATAAQLNNPWDVAVDSHGNVYIADSTNNVIREVTAVDGKINTIAGGGAGTGSGVGPLTVALNTPTGVYVDAHDNLFISDTANNVIRDVAGATPPTGQTAGLIYTVAGVVGSTGAYAGDGVAATTANLHSPSNVWVDASGNVFIADTNAGAIREVAGTPASAGQTTGDIYTVDGNGHAFFGGDGLAPTNAQLSIPATGIATDTAGNFYIADSESHVIREVTGGVISTVVGVGGSDGYGAEGEVATLARLEAPNGVFVDKGGNIYIADTGNNIVRFVPLTTGTYFGVPLTGGDIYTIAGTPMVAGYSGDMGSATAAKLNAPFAVAVDSAGNVFIADTGNNAIREVPALTANGKTMGNIYTVAGVPSMPAGYNGQGAATSAFLNGPEALFVDGFGNLFIADTGNEIVREVPAVNNQNMVAGTMYTLAGVAQTTGTPGDGGPATSGNLANPSGLYVDPAGDIFVADTGDQAIREVVASTGKIQTVAGTETTAGFAGDGGAATAAQLDNPVGLAYNSVANALIFMDTQNVRARSFLANGLVSNPGLVLSTTALTFTNQAQGFVSAAQSVVLLNAGATPVSFTSEVVGGTNGGDFNSTTTCGPAIAAGTSCSVNVTFKPTATGPRTATLTITDGGAGSPQVITLNGTGIAAGANFSTTSLTFSGQLVSTPSASQPVTITNNGTAALTFTGITVTGTDPGDFSQTNNCPMSPASLPNTGANTCTINAKFTPTAIGTRTASISVADSAPSSPQVITLTGTGTAPIATLSAHTVTFTSQVLGVTSAAQMVTLSNTGTAAMNITSIVVGGANVSDYLVTNTCGTIPGNLSAGANCTFTATFTPSALGTRTATITITDSATGSPQVITLTGTGGSPAPAATLTTPAAFAGQLVGTTSAAEAVTLTNTSTTAALAITKIAVSGDYAEKDNCGTSVAANASCTINVTFTPTGSGIRAGTITVTDNGSNNPQTASLTGTGVALSLVAASGSTLSQTVTPGQTATYNMQITASAGLTTPVSVALTCTGAPALVTLTSSASPVMVSSSTPGAFTCNAATVGSSIMAPGTQFEPKMQPPAALRTLPLTILALLLSIAAMLTWMQSPAGRLRTVRLAFSACLILTPIAAATLIVGCGGGSSGGTTPPAQTTAPGTYTLTVTATANGKSQTTPLTLIVQ